MHKRLKELRKALGIKQRELAERLGVAVGLVGRWETGQQTIATTRIYQICNEYNVNRDWLERGEGEMFKPKLTEQDKFVQMFTTLYDDLSPEYQAVFRRVAREILGVRIPEPDQPDGATKTQNNFGSVGGDMIQH